MKEGGFEFTAVDLTPVVCKLEVFDLPVYIGQDVVSILCIDKMFKVLGS